MPKQSAGLLAYRYRDDVLQVLLVHPGGPFYMKKDLGAWSIPKGEYAEGEDPLEVAKREFEEETGNQICSETFLPLLPVRLKSGKEIKAWAVAADFDQCFIRSNEFEMEWPPRSGKKQSFPEVDKAEWFTVEEARQKLNPAQVPLVLELIDKLSPI
ncbi:MAG: hydrolase [Sphingobacteriaceae bacterium]|jgi:predicted NUDIX family NTP pyrophosphohydrolase|nr:hydrolase [Sphingobacteriaceae bacterium]